MLEVQRVRQNKEAVIAALAKRGIDATQDIEALIAADDQRKQLQTKSDDILMQVNTLSKEIGELFKSGQAQEANEKKTAVSELKASLQSIKDEAEKIEGTLTTGTPIIVPDSFSKSIELNKRCITGIPFNSLP